MPPFDFIIATPDDKGRPTQQKGWLQKVNTHSAFLGGAARKRKALQDRASLVNESRRQATAQQSNEQVSGQYTDGNTITPDSGPSVLDFESPISVESVYDAILKRSPSSDSSPTPEHGPDLVPFNGGINGEDYWVLRCQGHKTVTDPVDCARCGPFEMHFPTEARHYRQGLRVQRWLSSWVKIPTHVEGAADASIHVSTGLTPRENTLLRFWFQDEKKSPPNDTSCEIVPELGCAHPDASMIFALTHLAMSEYGLFRFTGRLQPNFYRHRAEAYRAANEMLSDPDASLAANFSALQNLHIMDVTLGRLDLLELHAQARDRLLASYGGLSQLFIENTHSAALVEPTNILLMVLWSTSANRFPDFESFDTASHDFTTSLSSISEYVTVLALQTSRIQTENGQDAARLGPLFRYLQKMIDDHLRQVPDPGYSEIVGACTFALLFDLAMSVAEIKGNVSAVVGRFERLQHYMMASATSDVFPDRPVDEGPEAQLFRLAPYTVLAMISHVRRYAVAAGISPLNPAREIKVCSASINAVRIFSLLSRPTRLHIARSLLKCLLGFTGEARVGPFDEQRTGDIATELRSAWMARQNDQRA